MATADQGLEQFRALDKGSELVVFKLPNVMHRSGAGFLGFQKPPFPLQHFTRHTQRAE